MKNIDPPPQRPPILHPRTQIYAHEIIDTTADPAKEAGPVCGPLADPAVLAGLAQCREMIFDAETGRVFLASEWARTHLLNLPEHLVTDDAASDPWFQDAQLGRPDIEEFYLPEFAHTAGLSECQARKLIRSAIMLTHLLPKVWDRALAGDLEVYRVRKLAEKCWDLTPAAIGYIDDVMSSTPNAHTDSGRMRVIAEAKHHHMPAVAAAEAEDAKNARHATLDTRDRGDSMAYLEAVLDLPDAIILDKVLATGAAFYKTQGCTDNLDTRRAYALADIIHNAYHYGPYRTTTSTGITAGTGSQDGLVAGAEAEDTIGAEDAIGVDGNPRPRWDGTGLPETKIQFFLHTTPTAHGQDPTSPATECGPGTCAEELCDQNVLMRIAGTGLPATGRIIHPSTLRDWVTRHLPQHHARVRITKVIDLGTDIGTRSYTATDIMKTMLVLLNGTCVFPHCNKPAIRADCDHINRWEVDADANPTGGATCTCNLAPACRSHHLLKTHGAATGDGTHTTWTYAPLGEGKFLWTGPNNIQALVTPKGTFTVTPEPDDTDNDTAEMPAETVPVRELTKDAVRAHRNRITKKNRHSTTTTRGTKNRTRTETPHPKGPIPF